MSKPRYKAIPLWAKVSQKEWNDWRWQVRNRVSSLEQLNQIIPLTDEEKEGIRKCLKRYRMAITPYYVSLMDRDDPQCPIRLQAIPRFEETIKHHGESRDPLREEHDSPVKNLVHRYPDRVLMLITDRCAMYCRHCTRRRFAGKTDFPASEENIAAGINYIKEHPEVRDIILSGGDALAGPTSWLESIIKRLRQIPHVEIIRIGTRTPVVCPQRITRELIKMLRRYHPIYLNTQFNHPKEITPEASQACGMLCDGGIPLANQSVLLRNINACPFIMKILVQGLLKIRVRPYYLFQCDMSEGIEHFRTPVAKGIEIMELLQGHTSGLALPIFVIDMPGGGGKVPIWPTYLVSQSTCKVITRNYMGFISAYTGPEDAQCLCPKRCTICKGLSVKPTEGLGKLFTEEALGIEPKERFLPFPQGNHPQRNRGQHTEEGKGDSLTSE